MKYLRDYWFSTMTGTIGIVVGEDEHTGERKAYIDRAGGYDQEADKKSVAENGQRLHPSFLRSLLSVLEPAKKK